MAEISHGSIRVAHLNKEEKEESFVSIEEAKASFIMHLQQSHPSIEESRQPYLVSSSMVPQPRSSDICPICGTLHQKQAIIQPETQPEATKENTKARFPMATATDEVSRTQR